jgi:hypothetical protein
VCVKAIVYHVVFFCFQTRTTSKENCDDELVSQLQRQYKTFLKTDSDSFEMDFIKSLRSMLYNNDNNNNNNNNSTKNDTPMTNIIQQKVFEMKKIIETHLIQNPSQLQLKYQHLLNGNSIERTTSQTDDEDENKYLPTCQQKLKEYSQI